MKNNDKYKVQYNILVYSIISILLSSPVVLIGLSALTATSDISFIKFFANLLFISAFVILYIIFKKLNIIKGAIGEAITRLIIQKYCDNSHYVNMHDLLLKNEMLRHSQIDHVVVTTKGIAVIETKYHVGYNIYVSEKDKFWKYEGIDKHRNKFTNKRPNPLHQNYGHILAIKELLKDETIQYYNIVSYVDTVTIEKCNIINNNSKCIYTYDLPKTIDELVLNDKSEKIGIAKMSKIVSQLREADIKDKNTRREHINSIKHKFSNKIENNQRDRS